MFSEEVTELGRDRYRGQENTDANWPIHDPCCFYFEIFGCPWTVALRTLISICYGCVSEQDTNTNQASN